MRTIRSYVGVNISDHLTSLRRRIGFAGPELLGAILLAAVAVTAAIAQTNGAATLVGTVTDSSGSVVAAAKVSIVNLATSFRSETLTSSEGDYFIPYLIPGTYQITL